MDEDTLKRAAVMLRQGVSAREVGRFLGRSHTWVNYSKHWLLGLLTESRRTRAARQTRGPRVTAD